MFITLWISRSENDSVDYNLKSMYICFETMMVGINVQFVEMAISTNCIVYMFQDFRIKDVNY